MHITQKNLIILFSFIAIVLSSKTSFAQFPGMAAVYRNSAAQVRNQQFQMQMDLSRNWRSSAGTGDTYEVTLKDSSVKKFVSFMYDDTIQHKTFLVFLNKKFPKSDTIHRNQKIYPEQTLYITHIAGFQGSDNSYGVPADSCWRFKIITGAISVYSKYFQAYDDGFTPAAITAIQLNDGTILTYTEKALKEMIATNPDAIRQFEKKNYLKAIKKFNSDAGKSEKK